MLGHVLIYGKNIDNLTFFIQGKLPKLYQKNKVVS